MRAYVKENTLARTVTLSVSEVPEMDVTDGWHKSPMIIRPDTVLIRIVDAEIERVTVNGLLMRSRSGQPSSIRSGCSFGPYADRSLVDAADWVRTLCEQVLLGGASFTLDIPEVSA